MSAGAMRVLAALILIMAAPGSVWSGAWKVSTVALPGKPLELVVVKKRRGLRGIRIVMTNGGRLALGTCKAGLCAKPADDRLPPVKRPSGALPDAVVATGRRNVRTAWLAVPTRRYDHAVLGDAVEAGALVALDRTRRRHRHTLGGDSVFEDRHVRLADLDRDGADELVVVRSYAARGAALAVLELDSNGLRIAAETPPIGKRYRWLNPAGIADFDGDGRPEIALVVTPHIGGTLEVWEYRDGKLHREARLRGFSNHVIGSRVQLMSAVADFDGDGIDDLALPDDDRRAIRIISLAEGRAAEPARIALPGAAVTEILAIRPKGAQRPALLVGLDTGKLAILR